MCRRSTARAPTRCHALENVDLSVDRGSLVAVMGPSGSGKSTLLTIAGSLEEPTSGEVLVDGRSLSTMSRNDKARLRRRTIGYVFQDFNLLPGLTAVENVSLPLELDGMSAKQAQAAGMAALEELGLADRADHYPDELSGGERQRVAIARAVVGDRHLLLADEPSGALDSVNGEAVMRLILAACRRGRRRRRGHPRRAARLVGRPGRVPSRRPRRRPDGAPAEPGVAARSPARSHEHRSARASGDRRALDPGGVPGRPPGDGPLGVAPVPAGVAPATARSSRSSSSPWPPPSSARRWRPTTPRPPTPGSAPPRTRPTLPGSDPHLAAQIADPRASLRPRRRHREPDAHRPRLDQHLRPACPEPARPLRPADALARLGHFPAGAEPGGHDRRRGVRLRTRGRRRLAHGRRRPAGSSASSRTRRACSTSSPWSSPGRSRRPPRSPCSSTPTGARPSSIGPNVADPGVGGVDATRSTPRPSRWPLPTIGMLLIALVVDRRLHRPGPAPAAVARHARLARGDRQEHRSRRAGERRRRRRRRRAGRSRRRDRRLARLPTAPRGQLAPPDRRVGAAVARRSSRPWSSPSWPRTSRPRGRPERSPRFPSWPPCRDGPRPRRQIHRSAVPGIVFLVVAFLLLGYAGGTSSGSGSGGAPELVFGLVSPHPGRDPLSHRSCLTLLARLGRRAPSPSGSPLRDLARYRARSGSALAAISLGVLIAVIIAIVAAARYGNVLDYAGPNLASNQLIVYTPKVATAAVVRAPPSAGRTSV